MGATKTDIFSEHHNEIATIAKAIGHPARVAIMEYVMSQKGCIAKDIGDEIPLSQPTISQHLKELKNAGIIIGSTEGNRICYCINPEVMHVFEKFISSIDSNFICKDDSCC